MVVSSQSLMVSMNGLLVGRLAKLPIGGMRFEYDGSWLNDPGSRPVSLSLPLTQSTYQGEVVYHFFDNLLPDNPNIRARIQTQFHLKTTHPFDLLSGIGRDCVGAVQLMTEPVQFQKTIEAEPLSEAQIAMLLKNYRNAPLGMEGSEPEFRISIAGAQEKSAFLFHEGQWTRPVGSTPTTHIFKLPIGRIEHQHMDLSDSCENEWLCAQIARAFDLPVASCEVKTFEGVKALVVERFDRRLSNDKTWLMRLPQEDFCQALGVSPNLKYQSDGGPGVSDIMKILMQSYGGSDRDYFFRAQILMWLLAAIDAHAKNFSLFLEPKSQFKLTPLYDIMSVYPLLATRQLEKQKIKMAMALHGKRHHYLWYTIQRRHFLSTARATHYSMNRAEHLLDEMLSKVDDVIAQVSSILPDNFPSRVSDPIFAGMKAFAGRLLA